MEMRYITKILTLPSFLTKTSSSFHLFVAKCTLVELCSILSLELEHYLEHQNIYPLSQTLSATTPGGRPYLFCIIYVIIIYKLKPDYIRLFQNISLQAHNLQQ